MILLVEYMSIWENVTFYWESCSNKHKGTNLRKTTNKNNTERDIKRLVFIWVQAPFFFFSGEPVPAGGTAGQV